MRAFPQRPDEQRQSRTAALRRCRPSRLQRAPRSGALQVKNELIALSTLVALAGRGVPPGGGRLGRLHNFDFSPRSPRSPAPRIRPPQHY